MKNFLPWIFALALVALAAWPSAGCQRRSAETVFPEYVKKKKEAAAARAAEQPRAVPGATPPRFFPEKNIE